MKRAVALCVVAAGLAAADGTNKLDGAYHAKTSTGDWPCPTAARDVTIASGRFSIAWDVDASVSIGTIDGTVDADGNTSVTTALASPLPRAFTAQAKKAHVSLADLRKLQFAVKVRPDTVTLTGGTCRATWERATTDVDCTRKPYAVPEWSEDKPYGGGAYTKVSGRIYRCAQACGVGSSPLTEDGTWTFVGRCAGAAAPAGGDGKWDASYTNAGNEAGADWRCPEKVSGEVTVAHGTLSLPWRIDDDRGGVVVGHIDATIHADGTTDVAAVVTIASFDPKRLTRWHDSEVSLAALRAFAPTITFIDDKDITKNEHGVGRRFELTAPGIHGARCSSEYQASDYQRQQFREEDGWKLPCDGDQPWSAKRTYKFRETATIKGADTITHLYKCQREPSCDATRPDRSESWVKVGRCQ